MKAYGAYRTMDITDEGSIVETELPVPRPGKRDLLVQVRAVSVNPIDTKMRNRIKGSLDTPLILGWDASGTVVETGEDVELFQPGDEVYYAGDISRQGSCSEFHLVDERIAANKPETLNFEEAAAMPLTSITAWESLFERLNVDAEGGSILIIGGAGGVGSIAIQLAKQVAHLEVIATASRKETAEWCRSLGADTVIDHSKPLEEEFRREGIEDVPYIFCLNSTESYLAGMNSVIRPQGKICVIAASRDGAADINQFQKKSITLAWESMFTRSVFKTPDMIEQHRLLTRCAWLFDSGTLKHTMTKSFGRLSAENLRKAHEHIESNRSIGKVTLFLD